MAIISPGSISRTKVAPTMSSAHVSLATVQPLASRPRTSGRKPCGSRAAYSVCSSMKTSENAPCTSGSAASAAASMPGCAPSPAANVLPSPSGSRPEAANSDVSTSVSEVARLASPPPCRASCAASSRVLVRFPLWPRARLADGVARNVGCAFSQTDEPLVEYRQCPMATYPRRVLSTDSSKTCATRPMSL